MAFMTISEAEAIYILAAIGRVSGFSEGGVEFDDAAFGMNLCKKIGSNLTTGELHESERLYQSMRFSREGDWSVNFVECYHQPNE
jgi:hypothetical protein